MSELDHLSYSSISTYLQCPKSWAFKYIQKRPMTSNPALVFGSALHKTIEQSIIPRLNGEPVDLIQLWDESWHAAVHEQEVNWGSDTPETIFNDGVRMLDASEVKATIEGLIPLVDEQGPVIERRVELSVPHVSVPVIGYVDMILADGVPCDFKTSARSWSQDQAQRETQPIFYISALHQAHYNLNPGLPFRHYVFVKTKTPRVEMWDTFHSPAELFWLFKNIQDVWDGINLSVFPGNPHSWKCSPQYCDFWAVCRGAT